MALFKKKAAPAVAEPMDLDAVMKKYDRESNTRVWEGAPKWVVTCILASFSIFCIYVTLDRILQVSLVKRYIIFRQRLQNLVYRTGIVTVECSFLKRDLLDLLGCKHILTSFS